MQRANLDCRYWIFLKWNTLGSFLLREYLFFIRELTSISSLAGIVLRSTHISPTLREAELFPWTHSMLFPEPHCHRALHVPGWYPQKVRLTSGGYLCGTHCTNLEINGASLALRGRTISLGTQKHLNIPCIQTFSRTGQYGSHDDPEGARVLSLGFKSKFGSELAVWSWICCFLNFGTQFL